MKVVSDDEDIMVPPNPAPAEYVTPFDGAVGGVEEGVLITRYPAADADAVKLPETEVFVGVNTSTVGCAVGAVHAGGAVAVIEILSMAAGGVLPTLASFCQVKITRTVALPAVFPISAVLKLNVALVKVDCVALGWVHFKVAPVKVVFPALPAVDGIPATGVTVVGAI